MLYRLSFGYLDCVEIGGLVALIDSAREHLPIHKDHQKIPCIYDVITDESPVLSWENIEIYTLYIYADGKTIRDDMTVPSPSNL